MVFLYMTKGSDIIYVRGGAGDFLGGGQDFFYPRTGGGPRIFLTLGQGGAENFFHALSGGGLLFFTTHFSKKCLKSHFFLHFRGF